MKPRRNKAANRWTTLRPTCFFIVASRCIGFVMLESQSLTFRCKDPLLVTMSK